MRLTCTDGSHLQAGREQEEREAGEGEGEGELWRGGALLAPDTHHLVVRGQTLTMSPASLSAGLAASLPRRACPGLASSVHLTLTVQSSVHITLYNWGSYRP